MYHDSMNRICVLKRPFYDYALDPYSVGGAVKAGVGTPINSGTWAAEEYGGQVLLLGNYRGSAYMNVLDSATGLLRWPSPMRMSGKICDPHHATYLKFDAAGYLWLVGGGRTAEPESADIRIKRSNAPLSSPLFSHDVSHDWEDINPGVGPGRGYKVIYSDQWANMWLFWQEDGTLMAKIYHHDLHVWSQGLVLFSSNVTTLGNWLDDFRWRSRKVIKDNLERFHLFIGTRPADDYTNVGCSCGMYYLRITPQDLSGMSLSEFQSYGCAEQLMQAHAVTGERLYLPYYPYNGMATGSTIAMTNLNNVMTYYGYGYMTTWLPDTNYPVGRNIYDLPSESWYTLVAASGPEVVVVDSFADLAKWVVSDTAKVSAVGNKLVFNCPDGIGVTASGTGFSFGTNFDITFDYALGPNLVVGNAYSLFDIGCGAAVFQIKKRSSGVPAVMVPNSSVNDPMPELTLPQAGKIRIARRECVIAVWLWDAGSSSWLWGTNPNGCVFKTESQAASFLSFSFSGESPCTWYLEISNLVNTTYTGRTGLSRPAGFTASKELHQLITDGGATWKRQGLFLSGALQSYNWAGDLISDNQPLAGAFYCQSTTLTPAPSSFDVDYATAFPWFVWDGVGKKWDVHGRDVLAHIPMWGMTNNGIGDVFISTRTLEPNSAGVLVYTPAVEKSSDGVTWTTLLAHANPKGIDSTVGQSFNSFYILGDPVGGEATITYSNDNGEHLYYSTVTIFEGANTGTMFRGQFGGYFGGNI